MAIIICLLSGMTCDTKPALLESKFPVGSARHDLFCKARIVLQDTKQYNECIFTFRKITQCCFKERSNAPIKAVDYSLLLNFRTDLDNKCSAKTSEYVL
ncbi:hypothetical protein BX666DRAFT_875984 [Dichotomocladium elegans]|nr:hypothetical protein BX666DRAFT_875984 [Dichotomocladium elegans]